jgi:hypothetical protein
MAQRSGIQRGVPAIPIASGGKPGFTVPQAIDELRKRVNDQWATIIEEINILFGATEEGAGTDIAPTNTPVPTGITLATNADGSMDVTLTWDYVQGLYAADIFVVMWREGGAPLPAPTVTDAAITVPALSRVCTFQGWDPNSNYRFGIAAARKGTADGTYIAGSVSAPVGAPDWADVSTTGNYSGLIALLPAVTVATNAQNGANAFTGTVNYRTAGAPNATITPTAISGFVKTDGSVQWSLVWTFTEGTRIADGILVFWTNNGGVPTLAAHHWDIGKGAAPGFTLEGVAQDVTVSFGVAAYRRTEGGIEIGGIVSSTASPDWQDLVIGQPNYAGTIMGLEQHTFTAYSAGLSATDQTVKLTRDGVDVWNPGTNPRSYTVIIYDTASKSIVAQQTCDAFLSAAEWMNVGLLTEIYLTGPTRVLILIGSHEPQANRLAPSIYARLVTSGTSFGVYQVCPVTPGQSYIASFRVRCTRYTSGNLRCGFNAPGVDAFTTVSTTGGIWSLVYVTGVIPAGVTTANPYFYTDGGPNGDWEVDDVRFELNTAGIGGNTNLVVNGGFQTGDYANWAMRDAPGASEQRIVFPLGSYTLDQLEKHGLDRASFTSTAFHYSSAFIFVGSYQAGPGNGLQVYAGTTDSSTAAMCRLTFQTQGTRVVSLSGTGWSPDRTPGVPTNNPVPSAAAVYAAASGTETIVLGWNYTQPDMSGSNKLADGFVVAVKGLNVPDPATAPDASYKVGVTARTFVMESPYLQTWSFAVAAYRRTASGIETGPFVTSAAGPDWQGIGGSTRVSEGGLDDNSVSTPKVQNLAVSTAKIADLAVTDAKISNLSAAKITTGLLTVNPVSAGATGIAVTNAGKIRLQTMTGTPSKISFEDIGGSERAAISGNGSGELLLTGNNSYLTLNANSGASAANMGGTTANVYGGNLVSMTSTTEARVEAVGSFNTGRVTVGTSNIQLDANTVTIPNPRFNLQPGGVGAFVGFIVVKNINDANIYKIPIYTS